MATGTYVIADLDANKDVTVREFGEDRLNEVVQRELDAHNAAVNGMLSALARETTSAYIRSGTGSDFVFEESDEQTRDRTQKADGSQTVGIPLKRFSAAIGWTTDMFEVMTLGQLQRQLLGVQLGDVKGIRKSIVDALFNPTNYTVFDEYGEPAIDLNVKALYNADGSSMGVNADGTAIDGSSHSHYLAASALDATLTDAAIETVVEHGYTEGVQLWINRAALLIISGLAKFTPALGPLVTPGSGITVANVQAQPGRLTNTPVGVWDGKYFVYAKSDVPAGYFAVVAAEQPEELRPFGYRVPKQAIRQGLRTVGEIPMYPLRTRYMRRFYGIGAYNRGAAAVADYSHGGAYQAPNPT